MNKKKNLNLWNILINTNEKKIIETKNCCSERDLTSEKKSCKSDEKIYSFY